MTCPQVQTNFSLYLYGELDFAQEEAIERHVETCSFCQLALEHEKSWHSSVAGEQPNVSFELLSECRRDLRIALRVEGRGTTTFVWWKRIIPSPLSATRWSGQLAAASFLVFVGFAAGRLIENVHVPSGIATDAMGLVNAPNARVRDIEPNGQNGVRILVDRVQQQEVTGTLKDNVVRQLILNATHDPSDPGIRVDSVELLQNQTGPDVRDALVNSVEHDTNAAVRLKALEGLRRFSGDITARQAVEFVLKHDEDPDVRSEAINILVPADQPVGLTPDILTTLEDILASEPENDYVRSRSMQVLHAVSAGSPVF